MRHEFANLTNDEKQAVRQMFTELQGILAPKGVTLPNPHEFSGSFPQLPYLKSQDRKRAYELIKALIPYSDLSRQRDHDRREHSKSERRDVRNATLAKIRSLRSRPQYHANMHPLQQTEQAVIDLQNAEQALALFYNRSHDHLFGCAFSLSIYVEDVETTEQSIIRGIALSAHYELVSGKRCLVSLTPVVPERALAYVLCPAGWVGTCEMHRHVAIALKHGHFDFV